VVVHTASFDRDSRPEFSDVRTKVVYWHTAGAPVRFVDGVGHRPSLSGDGRWLVYSFQGDLDLDPADPRSDGPLAFLADLHDPIAVNPFSGPFLKSTVIEMGEYHDLVRDYRVESLRAEISPDGTRIINTSLHFDNATTAPQPGCHGSGWAMFVRPRSGTPGTEIPTPPALWSPALIQNDGSVFHYPCTSAFERGIYRWTEATGSTLVAPGVEADISAVATGRRRIVFRAGEIGILGARTSTIYVAPY
jgi:hypothetical protein